MAAVLVHLDDIQSKNLDNVVPNALKMMPFAPCSVILIIGHSMGVSSISKERVNIYSRPIVVTTHFLSVSPTTPVHRVHFHGRKPSL
jgi:hypothetical protein